MTAPPTRSRSDHSRGAPAAANVIRTQDGAAIPIRRRRSALKAGNRSSAKAASPEQNATPQPTSEAPSLSTETSAQSIDRPRRLRRSRPAGAPFPDGTAASPSRRRRVRPRRLPWTAVQIVMAVLFWAALAAIVYGTDPENALALAGFFLALFGALFFTLAPIVRTISLRCSRSRVYQEAVGFHATRQALMISAFVVLNALLQMVRAWTALTALLLFGMFAVIEIIALTRR